VIPVPPIVSRRAWECAVALGLDRIAGRDPESLTWAECGALFRMHRLQWPVRV